MTHDVVPLPAGEPFNGEQGAGDDLEEDGEGEEDDEESPVRGAQLQRVTELVGIG